MSEGIPDPGPGVLHLPPEIWEMILAERQKIYKREHKIKYVLVLRQLRLATADLNSALRFYGDGDVFDFDNNGHATLYRIGNRMNSGRRPNHISFFLQRGGYSWVSQQRFVARRGGWAQYRPNEKPRCEKRGKRGQKNRAGVD